MKVSIGATRSALKSSFGRVMPRSSLLIRSARPGKTWYLPHHAVSHPAKPEKTRIVFDCSAKFDGKSLNAQLLQGPDLTNSLLGVLLRFRQEQVGITADIRSMFHMVRVPEEDADLLRFLWWPKGDTSREPQDYRMRVHLFGAVSSPSCANFALKKTAEDNWVEYGLEMRSTIERNFYVDDCLKSVQDADTAVKLSEQLRSACQNGGFHLTKFISNDSAVMDGIPEEDRAIEVTNGSCLVTESAEKRVLGILWNVSSDTMGFRVQIAKKPVTRRGILSTISSIFDPLGFVVPVLLTPKILLQQLCRLDPGMGRSYPAVPRRQVDKVDARSSAAPGIQDKTVLQASRLQTSFLSGSLLL